MVFELKPIEPRKRYGVQTAPRVPLRLAVVIDISHSMEEVYGPDDQMSKLEKVKLFAQLLASTMDEDDYLAIITFGTKANIALPLMKMTPEAKVRRFFTEMPFFQIFPEFLIFTNSNCQ